MRPCTSFLFLSALFALTPAQALAETGFVAETGFSPWDSGYGRDKRPPRPYDAHVKAIAAHFQKDTESIGKLWLRGYGRNELITLLLISKRSSAPLEELVRERDKKAILSELCARHGLLLEEVMAETSAVRKTIDAKASQITYFENGPLIEASTAAYSAGLSTAIPSSLIKPAAEPVNRNEQ